MLTNSKTNFPWAEQNSRKNSEFHLDWTSAWLLRNWVW